LSGREGGRKEGREGGRERGRTCGNGLLAEDVLAGGRAGLDLVSMVLGGGADPDGVHVGVVDDLGRSGGREGAREGGREGGCE